MKNTLKLLSTSAKANCLVGLSTLCLATLAHAVPSSDGAGEIAIYSEVTAGEAVAQNGSPASGFLIQDFDTTDREDSGSFTLSGTDITLNRAGHYLAIYNSRFDSPAAPANGEQRNEVQSYLTIGGTPLASGWSQGFIRRQEGHRETITSGMALIEATAADVLNLRSFRSDTLAAHTTSRVGNASGIQLIKLDEVNMSFARLSLAANLTGPATAAQVKVPYDTDDELDTGFTHGTAGDLTLVDAGKYLVIANTSVDGNTNRTTIVQRLTLDGVEVNGSKTTAYMRASQGTNNGTAAIGTIIEATAGQVLNVEASLDVNQTSNFIGGRCALTVIKLPSSAAGTVVVDPDFIRLRHTVDQNINAATDTALIFATQDEVDLAFSHTSGAAPITVNTAGDYLFLSSVYDNDDTVPRSFYNQGWSVNGGVRSVLGQSGRYARNTGGADQFGNTSGFIGNGLSSSDTISMVSSALGRAGVHNANSISLQGVRLASLFTSAASFEVTIVASAVSTTEGGVTVTYDMALGLAPAGTVTVTVSPDAQSEVSSDGTNFFSTLDVDLSDTTPQTITVRATDDAAIESAHSSTITHAITATADATNYPTSLPVPSVTNSITDNDVVPVVAVADASSSNLSEDAMGTESILAPQADLLANDTDGFNNVVSASDTMSALGAAVSVNSDGTFTYDPTTAGGAQMIAAGATATDTFSYTAQDADGNTNMGTVSITLDGANDGPSASDDNLNDGPLESATSFISSADLTANDGIFNTVPLFFPAGSDLGTLPGITASQSTTLSAIYAASTAFDGNFGNFTHTAPDNTVDHSWEVDFGQDVILENVSIFNRTNCCAIRLRDITVTVLDSGGATIYTSAVLNPGNALAYPDAASTASPLFDDFGGSTITGRRLVITRTPDATDPDVSDGSVLSLGEVTIIGSVTGTFFDDKLVAHHDASTSLGTAGRWENIGSGGGTSADWVLGSGVTLNSSVTSAHAQITGAYEWDGTTNATALFPGGSINGIYGGAVDQGDSAIEIWAKLDAADLTQISTLFETGGGTGTGLVVDNGVLRVANGINVGAVSYNFTTDPDGVLLGAATAEFFQIVMVMDFVGDQTRLYVNGTLVGNNNNGTTDWDGGDASGLGHFGGNNHGGFQNGAATTAYDTHFNGSMASFRVYSTALTGAQVLQNYKAVNSGTDIDGDTISVVGVLDGGDTFVANGSPATLLSGAIVTMNNATGGFDYNPNGAIDPTVGQTLTDTFTYRVSDGNGGAAEAEATVTITGVVNLVDDNLLAKEAEMKIYTPNEVIKNDETLATLGAYINLVPGSFGAPTWTNQGSAGASFNGTITGSLVESPDLISGFELIGCASSGTNLASLDPISTGDATLEIWFKPDAGQTGKKTVFETGGNGNGFSIVYDPATNEVIANFDGGDDTTATIIATAGGVVTTEFNQIIVTIDVNGGAEVGVDTGIFQDLMSIYLNNDPTAAFNGTAADTGTNTLGIANDWVGTDLGGLLKNQGTTALDENFDPAAGTVAIFRAYTSILSAAEMEANFNASIQPITAVSSPSAVQGAAVTLNGDGTITVDYSGVSLAPGASLMDSFTYTTADGTATANILIEGNTLHEDWRFRYYGDIEDSGAGADSVVVVNGLTNLQNFALALDPTAAAGTLDVDAGAGSITTLGPPAVWVDSATGGIYLRHTRRADFAAIPLTITNQFSRALIVFEDSVEAPAVIATGTGASGVDIEAVQTEFPLILPVSGAKGRFGRVEVTIP